MLFTKPCKSFCVFRTEVLLKVINANKKLNFGAAALICEVKIALMYQVGSK